MCPFGRKIREQPVAQGNRSVGQDVRVQSVAVDEILDAAGPGEALQVQARLADLDADALDIADPEALAGEADVFEYFRFDQGQRVPGRAP